MPTTVNATRPRKVRCPKCTALLTEPQTQIYKCPICSTLLLAKGNSSGSSGRSSEFRLQGNSRDAEDIQQTAEGGSKLEKSRLVHESGKEKLLQGMDHVKKEGKPFEESDGPSRSDSLYESTDTVFKLPLEGDLSSDLDDQPLSRRTFLSQRTHPSDDDLVPKINVSSFERPPYPPHRRKASHHSSGSGENSDKSEEGDCFSELDSASHTESEVDMESSVWSSENANASGVLEVMPSASKTAGSSLVESSGERLSPLVPSQSSAIISNLEVVGDGAYMQQEESEHAERHQFDVWSRDGGTEEEAVYVERHQSWSPDGATSDEVLEVERGLEVDYRTGNEEESEMTISRESFLDEGYTLSDQNHPEVADNKEIDKLHCSAIEVKDEEVANTGDIERLHGNLVESRFKNETFDDSRHPLSDEVSIEVADDKHIGKVQSSLFDLSVFGIYDENTYLEMRRGKEAHYSTLSGNDSQGDSQGHSRFDREIVSEEHPHESASQNTFSAEQDCAKDDMHQDMTGIWKQSSVSDVPESEIESTCTKTGCYSEMPLEASQHDSDMRSSLSVEQEVGDRNLGDAGLWSVTTGDKDVLVNARYGNALSEKDLSSEVLSSIDMSFCDWQSQQAVKPHEALEQKHMEADLVDEERMLNSDTGDPTDSSWEDNEDLTFSSTPKDSKLEQTTSMEKDAQAFSGTRKSSGTFLARRNEVFSEKPAFPLRTAAMQMFLRRTEQEGTAQTQVQQKVMESEANIYKAPYDVDHYVPQREEKDLEATDQASALASEKNLHEAPHAEQHEPHDVMSMMAITDPLDRERPVFETEKESSLNAHLAMRHTPLSWNEEAAMNVRSVMEDVHSRKEFDSERGQHRDATEDKMDQRDMERLVSDTPKAENLNVQHLPLKKLGNSARKPISLGWKGKVVTDTEAPSSMEDLGGHKMEFAPGRERDVAVIQGTGLTEGHSFSVKGGKHGSGQRPRSHSQPDNRVFSSQRTQMIDDDVKFREQKHESGDHVGPDRAAWHRPSKGSLSNSDSFKQSDMLHMKGRFSNSDSFGQLGVDRREHASALQGQALHPNRSLMDEGSSYIFNGATDYNSDHSARSQEVLSHPQFNKQYSDPHGLAVPSNRAYPFPVSSHGSMAPAFLQEQGFTHSARHCVSPVCPFCIQQQYHMQQPPMLQNMMMHPCAACVSQPPGAAYQPILHDPHHMQLSSYSNPSLRQRESGFPPAQSRRQNRSNSHLNYPAAAAKKTKLYPPLPWKGAPPYVLCKDCNQMLKVPAYLPPNKKPIQKLRCGACGKVSKFSVPMQANSQSFSKSSWQSTSGSAMNAYQFSNSSARDQRHTDTASVHSSEQISSLGPGTRQSTSTQNLAGMARYGSGTRAQHEWVENQMLQQTNAATIADSDMDSADHGGYHLALAGGVLGLGHFRSQVRYSEGVSHHNNAVFYSEGYLSSSPSSASGSSPGIRYQLSGQQQKVEALRRERAVFGERKMSHDLLARPAMYEQDGPPFEAPSFSDGFFQKDSNESRSRFSSTSLQGSLQDPFNESPRNNDHEGRHQPTSRAGSWQNQPADAGFSKSSSTQLRKMPVTPGSPLIEHFTEDAEEVGPSLRQRRLLQASGNNGSRSAPWSPATGSPLFDHLTYDTSSDFSERSREREWPPPSTQDTSKGPKYYAGLLKRSLKDLGKGGQGSNNRRKVVVNGHLITEAAVRKAEEQAGTIHPGSYWYDYKAGFWGAMGGPCLGILLPFIEEFNFPLARGCAGGTTGILVNGRELHEKDLEVLAKRGLSKISGKAYIVDINGKVFDDASGQQLKGLGRLAPSIEKKGRGCGMFQPAAQP